MTRLTEALPQHLANIRAHIDASRDALDRAENGLRALCATDPADAMAVARLARELDSALRDQRSQTTDAIEQAQSLRVVASREHKPSLHIVAGREFEPCSPE